MRNPHYDMIVEWAATGKPVQMSIDKVWMEDPNPLWLPQYKYRFKPAVVKYRLALMRNQAAYYIDTVYTKMGENRRLELEGFVGWISDWQEAEINE